MNQVSRANVDLVERVQSVGLTILYDPEEDCVLAYIGSTKRPAITQAFDSALYLRLDPNNYKILGFEVLDFKKHVREPGVVRDFFGPLEKALIDYGGLAFYDEHSAAHAGAKVQYLLSLPA